MPRKRLQTYVILYRHDENYPEPAFYWLDEMKGKNSKDAIKRNLAHLLKRVREILSLRKGEVADYKLERNMYVIPVEHWLSARGAYWRVELIAEPES